MPRIVGQSVPKYRKHRASGQAVVTVNGRDFYLGPHGTKASKLEYDRVISEWLSCGRSVSFGSPVQDVTIVELIADYLRFAKGYYGDGPRGTLATMKRAVRPLKNLYGRTSALEFGPAQLKAVRTSLIAEGISRTHINDLVSRIASVFRWAAEEGRIPAAIAQNISAVRGLRKGRCDVRETEPVKPVDLIVVESTIPHLSPVVATMVRLQMLTGSRPGEICALRAGDIDRTDEVWKACLVEHKTAHRGRDRTLYFGPQAQDALRPFLLRPADAFCFSPAEAMAHMRARRNESRKTPISCGNRVGTNRRRKPARTPGDRYTTQSYGIAIARACKLASVEHWSPGQLRHTVATDVRRRFGLEATQVLLGHSRADVTQVYALRDESRVVEVVKQIG